MLYYELLPGIRMILGMCCIFVMTGALFLFVTVCIRHMGLGQLLLSLTLAAVDLVILDVMERTMAGESVYPTRPMQRS